MVELNVLMNNKNNNDFGIRYSSNGCAKTFGSICNDPITHQTDVSQINISIVHMYQSVN